MVLFDGLRIFLSSHSFILLQPIFFLVLFLHDSKTGHLLYLLLFIFKNYGAEGFEPTRDKHRRS